MSKKMIKPVLRYPGSKYKKIKQIIKILDINKEDLFLDLFGGSLIVGVNVKQLTNAYVCINDYDKVYPIKDKFAVENICSFQGLGKNYTKSAENYFYRRVRNGYWKKLDIYNKALRRCDIISKDYKKVKHKGKIYVDPPYTNAKGLYKHDSVSPYDLYDYLTNLKKDNKILISYNDTKQVREIFHDWYITNIEYQYTTGLVDMTGKKKKVNELFITNFKIKESKNEK